MTFSLCLYLSIIIVAQNWCSTRFIRGLYFYGASSSRDYQRFSRWSVERSFLCFLYYNWWNQNGTGQWINSTARLKMYKNIHQFIILIKSGSLYNTKCWKSKYERFNLFPFTYKMILLRLNLFFSPNTFSRNDTTSIISNPQLTHEPMF